MIVLSIITITLSVLNAAIADDYDILPELKYLDTSIDPCDNFYQFSCGKFKEYHPKPPDQKYIDHFSILEEQLIQIGQGILSQSRTDDDPIALKKVKIAYSGCVNTDFTDTLVRDHNDFPEFQIINQFDGFPLILDENQQFTFTWNDIGDMVGQYGVPLIFTYTVSKLSQNTQCIVIQRDGLADPKYIRPEFSKTYDQILNEAFANFAKYSQLQKHGINSEIEPSPFNVFIETLAQNLNQNQQTEEKIQRELNEIGLFVSQLLDGGIIDDGLIPLAIPATVAQLQNWTEVQFQNQVDLNWKEYLGRIFKPAGIEVTDDLTLIFNFADIYGIINLIRQTDPRIVKNFAMLRLFLFLAPDSYQATRQAFEDFYTATQNQFYNRSDYCTRKILDVVDTASLSFAVGYEYQRHHFNANKYTQAAQLLVRVQETFNAILGATLWMDEESRAAALQKAHNILILLAYPDFVDQQSKLDAFYENVRICEWDNYGNAYRMRAFRQAYLLTQLGNPTDRTFWDKSVFDVNAYYNQADNKIVLPIAMLNGVFFNGTNNPIIDYSRLGSIIGHEITHGFDAGGKDFNADGDKTSWWSNETLTNFEELTTCFIDQYNQFYIPEIGAYVDGSKSLNENLADNAGVRQSYKTLKKLIDNGEVQVELQTWTWEQIFFIGYSTMWCTEESEEYLTYLQTSKYAPNRYRVNGATSNMVEFAEAFNCPIGTNMNPSKKCVLW